MEVAIVYYSRTGSTRQAAQMISDEITNKGSSASLIELEATGRTSPMKACLGAMLRTELPMKDADTDMGKYDMVIIGSPVWVRCPAPFIRQFMKQAQNINGKKGASFSTSMGMNGRVSARMKQIIRDAGVTPVAALELSMKKTDKTRIKEQVRVFVEKVLV